MLRCFATSGNSEGDSDNRNPRTRAGPPEWQGHDQLEESMVHPAWFNAWSSIRICVSRKIVHDTGFHKHYIQYRILEQNASHLTRRSGKGCPPDNAVHVFSDRRNRHGRNRRMLNASLYIAKREVHRGIPCQGGHALATGQWDIRPGRGQALKFPSSTPGQTPMMVQESRVLRGSRQA